MAPRVFREIDNDLASTCAHELAHALLMRELDFEVKEIKVRPFLGGGYCEALSREYDTWSQVMDGGVVDLGGFQGEDRWRREHDMWGASSFASGEDYAQFRRLVQHMKEQKREHNFDGEMIEMREHKIRQRADQILDTVWDELNELIPVLGTAVVLKGLPVRPVVR